MNITAEAAEFVPEPTLGEDSAYTLTEVPEAGADSLTLYELKDKMGSYSYVDKNGETVTKTYTTVEALPHYYDMTITAESAKSLTNSDAIGEIVDHFIGQTNTAGGGIYNTGTIVGITGDFINNTATGSYGGGIFNYNGTIGPITGDFINNSGTYGGAIASYGGELTSITGNFINNTATSGYGGAIFEISEIDIDFINGNFIGNESKREGGAIYSYYGKVNSITGNFINNHSSGSGGGIYNGHSKIDTITGNFINNTVSVEGGAINNNKDGVINSINGNFINNSGSDYGGAISNLWKIKNITGYFSGNYAGESGGAIITNGLIDTIEGIFINNSAKNGGGVLRNYLASTLPGEALVKNMSGDFIRNTAGYGGVIFNHSNGTIENLSGNFVENSVSQSGGAIDNYDATIETITGQFLRNTAVSETEDVSGGAINNDSATIGNIVNSDFIGNSAVSTAGEALGGAIYSDGGSIALTAKDGYTSTFKDNYTESAGERKNNAIYLTGDAVMDFKMENGGKFLMADGIDGTDYKLSITGDDISKTRFYLYNTINSGDVTLSNTTIDMVNRQIAVNTVNNLTIGSDTNLAADVDLANKTMDRFTSPAYGTHSGNLTVSSVNLLSDGKENVTAVLFADEGLKDNAGTTVKTAYTPIYKYDVSYDNRDDAGYMLFTRGGAGSNSPDSYNWSRLNDSSRPGNN